MDGDVELTAEARRMVAALDRSYAASDRIEAQIALRAALVEAGERFVAASTETYDAPALSPVRRARHPLRRFGWRWMLARHYWIAFLADGGTPTIAACFHETSPGTGPVRRSRITSDDY